ncbi:hypothetical protein H072_888 [Dactylellina haptotyla CBS 200.50]|uniref:BTB domain-containing protein n=1 Tax=Dactylellina haptotyla (strain CBS 200.50) TaxID=1284197 RepID=S8CBR8_DACHA|nr:hypothetical protein H072_888 [Dactylellina haptotyla CBS 200.50]
MSSPPSQTFSPLDVGATVQYCSPSYSIPPPLTDPDPHPDPAPTISHPLTSYGDTCDLIVNLRNTKHEEQYLVSSAILQIVSPVWRRFIKPNGFADLRMTEVNGVRYPILDLHDDDFKCLTFLFDIVHFRPSQVPTHLTYYQLRNMAIVCDKYNCWPALSPWKDVWLNALVPDARLAGYEDWLFIATTCGFTHSEISALEWALVVESGSLSVCGSYFFRYDADDKHVVNCKLIPQPIIGMNLYDHQDFHYWDYINDRILFRFNNVQAKLRN